MEDLDDYLEGELASINEMFEQFQTKDQKRKQRILTEEEELKAMEKRAKEVRRLNCAWRGWFTAWIKAADSELVMNPL